MPGSGARPGDLADLVTLSHDDSPVLKRSAVAPITAARWSINVGR